MALLESEDLPLGASMPPFVLDDPHGEQYASRELMGPNGLLVVFTCNHCPYAKAVWPRLVGLGPRAAQEGVGVVAINPNIHPDYPEDGAEAMVARIEEWEIPFPYLVDADQSVAHAFGAVCTPDPFLFDADARLYYHGRIDDNWRDAEAVRRRELLTAIEGLAAGQPAPSLQEPAMGCSIKWRGA